MNDFQTSLDAFLAAVNEGFNKKNVEMAGTFPEGYYKPASVNAGSKFLRIVSTSGGSRSVYCFVSKDTGGIFKAAGWKAPAKGERANIFKPESYEKAKSDPYTGWLYLR